MWTDLKYEWIIQNQWLSHLWLFSEYYSHTKPLNTIPTPNPGWFKVITDKIRDDEESASIEGDWKFAAMVGKQNLNQIISSQKGKVKVLI